ncbi:MAG: hypothetical protein JNL50_12380 [Phycisphaerae bacterium]|nr:hypothetical protein [Phycisphaerae bacterium]
MAGKPSVRALAVVNGALILALGLVMLSAPATAQPGNPARARGEYTMVAGKTVSGSNAAVYILDAANREMVAVRWDQTRKSLVGIGYRNLDTDSKAQPGR